MNAPSTDWKEAKAPNEDSTFERLANELGALQRKRAQASIARRGLHAKSNVATRGTFEVLADVPAHAKVGLFATPATYQAVIRFSNGTGAVQEDKKPDVRGIGVKLLGVGGKKIIPGMEQAPTQDFLAILSSAVPFRTPEEFVWVVLNATNPLTFLPKALFHLGFGRAGKLLGQLQKGLGQPIHSLANNHYFSALPIRFGAYAAKYCFEPLDAQGDGNPADLGAELADRLDRGPVRWAFKVQFYVDEQSTPIEDPTVDWRSQWVQLGILTVAQQSIRAERGQKFAQWAEGLSFDPWHAQEEFRPLGAMMRARGPAYRVSNQVRGAAAEPAEIPADLR